MVAIAVATVLLVLPESTEVEVSHVVLVKLALQEKR